MLDDIVCPHDMTRMGRTLSADRREAAIAWWRNHLSRFLDHPRPTVAGLAEATGIDLAAASQAVRAKLTSECKALRSALELPPAEQEDAIDLWISRNMVAFSPDLLIDERRRTAVMVTLRDLDRRARQANFAGPMMTLRIPKAVGERLRLYRHTKKFRSDGEAIDSLMPASRSQRKRQPQLSQQIQPQLASPAVISAAPRAKPRG